MGRTQRSTRTERRRGEAPPARAEFFRSYLLPIGPGLTCRLAVLAGGVASEVEAVFVGAMITLLAAIFITAAPALALNGYGNRDAPLSADGDEGDD